MLNKSLKKYASTLLMVLVLLTLPACSQPNHKVPNADVSTSGDAQKQDEPKVTTTPEPSAEVKTEADPEEPIRSNATFRQSIWKDDMDTIIKYETADHLGKKDGTSKEDFITACRDEGTSLVYEGKIVGYDTYIMYNFDVDYGLYNTAYGLYDGYTSAGMDIARYNTLKESLSQKYGEPAESGIINLENQSLIDTAGEAKALEYGYVVYKSIWKTAESKITLGMISENFDVTTVISYEDINYVANPDNNGL